MKFLILDIYTNDNWRLVKDTAGGYGTGNDFGNGLFSKILNLLISKSISMPPMYSMYIFSILKKKHDVEYSKKIVLEEIKASDYIIFPTSIICHETEINTLKELEKLNKKVFIVGIFGNVKYKSFNFKNTFIVPGEPEAFFLNIDVSKESLDKFFNCPISVNSIPKNPTVENLDDLPFPDWKYYSKKYPLKNNFLNFNNKIAVPIIATRGCPYSCFNYCTYPLQQGRKVRFRSVENIVNEIKYWTENLKTNKFIFRDPVFSINREYTIKLCNKILDEKLKINFLIETHLKNLDDELIEILKQAGLKFVYVGIESVNSNVLKDIKRFTITTDQQYKIIQKLIEKKIYVKSMFMFANPEDNEKTIKETIEYSIKLPQQFVQYSIFTPYPGTPIYSLYESNIMEKKFEKFNQYNLVFKHKNLNQEKINKLKNFAYRKFYLRLTNLLIAFKFFSSFLK